MIPNSVGVREDSTLRRVAGTKLLRIGTFGERSAKRVSIPV